jgi:hypothetical protein
MHKIKTNFGIIHRIGKEIFEKETYCYGNLQFYPRKLVLSDLQVVTLASLMEAVGIDSENILYLLTTYPTLDSMCFVLYPQNLSPKYFFDYQKLLLYYPTSTDKMVQSVI